jgi:uncharacterized protein (TIGR02246 family)
MSNLALPARLAVVLLCVWPASSLSMSATPNAGDLLAGFVAAWNSHDAAAFGHLMAADADWVTASGKRLHGREQIVKFLAGEHSTWAKTTTMRTRSIHMRMLDAKTAVLMLEWEIVTPGDAGAAPAVARGNNVFVARENNGWLIVAGQVARAPPDRS